MKSIEIVVSVKMSVDEKSSVGGFVATVEEEVKRCLHLYRAGPATFVEDVSITSVNVSPLIEKTTGLDT